MTNGSITMKEMANLVDGIFKQDMINPSKNKIQYINDCKYSYISNRTSDSTLAVVLQGSILLRSGTRDIQCGDGSIVAVPAPSTFSIYSSPTSFSSAAKVLIIPFQNSLLEKIRKSYDIEHHIRRQEIDLIYYSSKTRITHSLIHFLTHLDDAILYTHSLMEILLVLANIDNKILSYSLLSERWQERVRIVIDHELSKTWEITQVCKVLATSESTLRRNLRREGTSFREILFESRMSKASNLLLNSTIPVYQIADQCGYKSVPRFTSNFNERFGLPPRRFRIQMQGEIK